MKDQIEKLKAELGAAHPTNEEHYDQN